MGRVPVEERNQGARQFLGLLTPLLVSTYLMLGMTGLRASYVSGSGAIDQSEPSQSLRAESKGGRVTPSESSNSAPSLIERGKSIFKSHTCTACHGDAGKGTVAA